MRPSVLVGFMKPASAAGGNPNLTMTGASYSTSAPKFGSANLIGGAGTSTLAMSSSAQTWECWFKGPPDSPSQYNILCSSDGNCGLMVGFGGNLRTIVSPFYQSGGGSNSLCDNNWHHIAMTLLSDNDTTNMFLDGVLVHSDGGRTFRPANPTVSVVANGGTGYFMIGGGDATGYGQIDEVRISNIERYPSAFTPPTSPFTRDANTVSLWHLDGNGVGS